MTRSIVYCLIISALTAAGASGQPKIARFGVRNSAGYAPGGFLNTGIAQGSIFTIFGSGLGPNDLQSASLPLPTQLAGTEVRISSGGQTVSPYLLYVSASQIAAILPSGTPIGTATVTVSYQGQTSPTSTVTVGSRKIGLYTLNQAGSGPAVAQNFISEENQPVNTLVTPARPGQVVTLWATGLGPVSGDEAATPQVGDLGPITLHVGSTTAKVLYAGRSGCCVGADQIIFQVPDGVEGCYVPVIAVTGSFADGKIPTDGPSSNFATISISSTDTCADPSGLTGDEIRRIQDSGTYRVGTIALSAMAQGAADDAGTARFSQVDFERFLSSKGIFGLPSLGSCVAYESLEDVVHFDALDAGPALNIEGPNGARTMGHETSGDYHASLGANFLAPGSYSVDNGGGGADIGAFQAAFTVPSPAKLGSNTVLSNFFEPVLNWSDGDPAGYVVITSVAENDLSRATTICTERTAAGTFQIPVYAYAIAGVGGPYGRSPNTVSFGSASPPTRFTAPGMDLGLVSATIFAPGINVP
jgi:uncharacterized protein (TIGR03437 family)